MHDTFVAGDVLLAAKMLRAFGPSHGLDSSDAGSPGVISAQLFEPEVTLLGKLDKLGLTDLGRLAITSR